MDDAEARRKERASWPARKFRLGEEPDDDLSDATTPEQRIAMMWQLTLSSWFFTQREIADYDRASMPCRVIRPGTPRR